jgi:hypothetical protein
MTQPNIIKKPLDITRWMPFSIFFVERIGGHTFIEVPSGRGRTDILILYQKWKGSTGIQGVDPMEIDYRNQSFY